LDHRAFVKRFVWLQFLNLRHSVRLMDELTVRRKAAT
jgi:hypothetical protein